MKKTILDIKNRFLGSDQRTKLAVKNAIASLALKGASIIASLLIVPMTINYLNPTKYGIWLTLSAIIGWVHFFDLGLSNGFRNRFEESLDKGDKVLAKQYVSTTYFIISCIVAVVLLILLIGNSFINWSSVLHISEEYKEELGRVFAIVLVFSCLSMVVNIIQSLLAADQRPAFGSVIGCIGQYVSLIVIYLLTKMTEGSLTNLALYYAGIPTFVAAIASIFIFSTARYKEYRPSFGTIKPKLVKSIMNLGLNFFVIYICLIFVFQIVNIVITREIGAEAVTQYNVANRYFNIIYMVVNIAIAPLWSAFTDAYTKRDFVWMRSMKKRMSQMCLVVTALCIVLLLISSPVYKIWIGDSVDIPFSLSAAMCLMIICQTFGNVFMTMVNGVGTMRVQMITYILLALISWPSFTFLSRYVGLEGVVIFPALVYAIQGLLARMQITKVIDNKLTGIWSK